MRQAGKGSRSSQTRCDGHGKGQAMAEGFVHTGYRDGRWRNWVEGEGDCLTGAFRNKETAVIAGGVEARRRRTVHVIHHQDGKISERSLYGSANRGARAA